MLTPLHCAVWLMNTFCLVRALSPQPLVAVALHGQTPDLGAGATVKRKKTADERCCGFAPGSSELCKLCVGTAFIVVDRAESNFTKSSHDTLGELCQSLSENRPTPSGTKLLCGTAAATQHLIARSPV